jgi:hypothetical protein
LNHKPVETKVICLQDNDVIRQNALEALKDRVAKIETRFQILEKRITGLKGLLSREAL